MKPRHITVRGVIFRNGQLLAQQLKPDSLGNERDYWCTPGGGLDPGESLLDGLQREMIEETGIAPRIGKLLFIQQYEDSVKEFIEFFYHIENHQDYETIDLAVASHGELEIKNVAFVTASEHEILPDFLQTLDIQHYIDTNQPVLTINNLTVA